jgi:hypothetical protein
MKNAYTIALLVAVTALPTWAKPWHNVFVLPSGYIGWVQVAFGDLGASLPPKEKKVLRFEVGESGVVRTRMLPVWFDSRDEFFYRIRDDRGAEKLVPVPAEYVIDYAYEGGFNVSGTPDGSPGTASWFFFIGPPSIREKVPWADIRKEKGFGHRMLPPQTYPVPGRMGKSNPQ